MRSCSGPQSNLTLGPDTNTNSSLMVDGHAQAHTKSRPASGRVGASSVPVSGRGATQDEHEHEPGHKPDEDLCWPGISESRLSLSSHSIYLNSADMDAVLTIAINHPRRCTPCLASHCSSLATRQHNIIAWDPSLAIHPREPTSTGSLRPMSSTQVTTSHTKQAARTPPRTSQAALTSGA